MECGEVTPLSFVSVFFTGLVSKQKKPKNAALHRRTPNFGSADTHRHNQGDAGGPKVIPRAILIAACLAVPAKINLTELIPAGPALLCWPLRPFGRPRDLCNAALLRH